ncbi:Hypothetical predicted protein, partial [Lynx pardinus]
MRKLRLKEGLHRTGLLTYPLHAAVGGAWVSSLPWTPETYPKVPLDERIIFSGNLFQYQEDNK